MDQMGDLRRTDYCGTLRKEDCGREVVVCGWVQRQRDLGQLIFIDVRDRTGIVQLAFDGSTDREIFEKAFAIRGEYVVMAKGTVRIRDSINHEIPTGDIEIYVCELRLLSRAQTPPFEITSGTSVKEELRLKHRFLDLRRPDLQANILMRHRVVKLVRDYFDQQGFVEIETPTLIKSTPEGARDYLVPSRVFNGKFFALPQSPQLYKQLLMLAGFDKYMQIARCYRDEDLRADRQPEFTQIDLEMSFAGQEEVIAVNEGAMQYIFKEALGVDVPVPFPRMTYREAMCRYGSDKPDIRFGMELTDLTALVKQTEFRVFAGALAAGGSVRAVKLPGGASVFTRKEIDKLTEWVKAYGAKGLAWTRVTGDGTSSSFEKFLSETEVRAIHEACGLQTGDVLLVVADGDDETVCTSLGALRVETAGRMGLIPKGEFRFLWVTDFPLFAFSQEENRYVAKHHPFTAPRPEDLSKLESDPGTCGAIAYDMVLNGAEIGGGSVRISDPSVQERMFRALGFTAEDAQKRFGFLIDAYRFGAPPHAGMAYGLDRLLMEMLELDSLRDVIAFPKVASSAELLSGAPDGVDEAQLKELGIRLEADAEKK